VLHGVVRKVVFVFLSVAIFLFDLLDPLFLLFFALFLFVLFAVFALVGFVFLFVLVFLGADRFLDVFWWGFLLLTVLRLLVLFGVLYLFVLGWGFLFVYVLAFLFLFCVLHLFVLRDLFVAVFALVFSFFLPPEFVHFLPFFLFLYVFLAWAAVKKVDSLWHSSVCMKVKRQLFRSIVEPILTYGLCAWSLTADRRRRVDGMFGRILRYCLGLQPAYLSHDLVNTEQLYGDIPFLSTMLSTRRVSLVAHTLRAHLDRRYHSLTAVLLFDPVDLRPLRGPRITVVSDLLCQCRIQYREQLVCVMKDRKKCRTLINTVERELQQQVYHTIFHRRIVHNLSYFDMPRKDSVLHIKLLNEDDSILDAYMALGKLRRPPTIWVPPRPVLPEGCLSFEWHHFRWFPKPSINALYVKPLTRKQEFAMVRDRALRAERKQQADQRRRALKALPPPHDIVLPAPRTITTRYGRQAAVLPRFLFSDDEDEGPSASGT